MSLSERLIHDAEGLNSGVWPFTPGEFITEVERFFTRSHAAIPAIDPGRWRLRVQGLVIRSSAFGIADLKRLPRREVTATLVCAGLRRSELLEVRRLPGELPWGPEAAGTGCWEGYSLSDLLRELGIDERARYVEFTGLDAVERRGSVFGFGGSIELAKALEEDVLLADTLNGAPLPPAHGFPMRAVVPGWIGARSVKWLGTITLLDAPSQNYFQRKAYRVQREINPDDPRDVSSGRMLDGVPLNSVIVTPTNDQRLEAGEIDVFGWAMGSFGRPIVRVEISSDGEHWLAATLREHGEWTWTFWQGSVRLPAGRHVLMVRAEDDTGAVQPASLEESWNVRGYCTNAWHRVRIFVH
ncbi:MAG: sulfite oxidase [Gemmatimonadaceae bacterium]